MMISYCERDSASPVPHLGRATRDRERTVGQTMITPLDESDGDAIGMTLGEVIEQVVVARVAGAEDHPLHG